MSAENDNAVWLEKAGVLAEALPFMRAHAGETNAGNWTRKHAAQTRTWSG